MATWLRSLPGLLRCRDGMRLGSQDEKGQGIVEYAFIIVLIALAVLVTVILLGHQVNNVYSNIEKGVKYATG